MFKQILSKLSAFILALAMPVVAYAHHPLAGAPMETFIHGFMSGIGHPILGFDHLYFILVMGASATFTSLRYISPLAYIGAMLVGCLAMTYGISLPAKELVISASILILGILVFRGKTLSSYTSLTLFVVFGLFHGSAFGETIFAQESTMDMDILMGYLFGLAAIQYTVAIGVGLVINRYMKVLEAIDLRVRLLGAMVAGAGSLLVLEHIEGFAFTALNIS